MRLPVVSTHDLWNAIDNGAALVDGDGVLCNVNKAFAEIFRMTAGELIGEPVEALIHDVHRHRHRSHRDRFDRAPSLRPMIGFTDLEGRRGDGSSVVIRIGLSPIEIDEVPYTLAIVREVSRRLDIERCLADERRKAGDSVKDGLARAELHDATIQRLFAIGIELKAHHERLSAAGVDGNVDQVVSDLDDIIDQMRLGVERTHATTASSRWQSGVV